MLLGRGVELARIDALLEAAARGEGGILALRGQPGIGKTVLLQHAAGSAAGFRILRAAGVESEAELPYAALHELLRPLTSGIDGLPAPQAAALRAAFGLEAGDEPDRLLVGLAALTLLAQAAEEGPVLCLVDDLQWIDGASHAALAFAARRLHAEPLALVVAARTEEGPHPALPGAEELVLAPLRRRDSEGLLQERHGERLGDRREDVLAAAAGNPLALIELADAAVEGETAPTSVEQTYLAALRRLPEETQALLVLAAADDAPSLARLAAAGPAVGAELAALEPAELARLVLVDGDAVTFKHPLARAVAYKTATSAKRREAHLALADAYEEADRRAWHLAAATVGHDESVARLLESSAADAIRRSGHAAASKALERAAELSPDAGDRARRLVRAAAAAHMGGQRDRRVELLDAAGPIDDVAVRVEAARLRGVFQAQEGALAEAMRVLLDAAADAFPVDRAKALDLVALAQEAAGLAGNHDAILEFGEWVERFGPAESTEEEIMLGLVRGFATITEGDRAAAAPALARAAELGRSTDDVRLLIWSGTAAMFLGEDDLAVELFRKTVAIARSQSALGALPFALHLLAGAERRVGDVAGAEADADEARALALETGQVVVAAGALSTLTALAALKGDLDRAEALAAETRAIAEPRRLPVALAGVARALAELDLAHGRAAEALATLEASVGRPGEQRRNYPYALFSAPLVAEAAARAGVADEAIEALESFESWAEAGGLRWAGPLVARCRALVAADEAEAERWFTRALELHAAAGSRYEAARTRLLFGEWLRRARRKAEARGHLREALAAFEQVGARLWAERALAELRATGATARKRDDSTRDELTPQELQVVRLVALGKTNPQVAAELFLSPKTVQYHLRKVFTKLGVATRTELTRLVADGRVAGAVAAPDAA